MIINSDNYYSLETFIVTETVEPNIATIVVLADVSELLVQLRRALTCGAGCLKLAIQLDYCNVHAVTS